MSTEKRSCFNYENLSKALNRRVIVIFSSSSHGRLCDQGELIHVEIPHLIVIKKDNGNELHMGINGGLQAYEEKGDTKILEVYDAETSRLIYKAEFEEWLEGLISENLNEDMKEQLLRYGQKEKFSKDLTEAFTEFRATCIRFPIHLTEIDIPNQDPESGKNEIDDHVRSGRSFWPDSEEKTAAVKAHEHFIPYPIKTRALLNSLRINEKTDDVVLTRKQISYMIEHTLAPIRPDLERVHYFFLKNTSAEATLWKLTLDSIPEEFVGKIARTYHFDLIAQYHADGNYVMRSEDEIHSEASVIILKKMRKKSL